MYYNYIGQVLKDADFRGKPIIELWDGVGYTLSEAKRMLDEINKSNISEHSDFQIISGKEYNIAESQGWE